jgi:hypothetical protein
MQVSSAWRRDFAGHGVNDVAVSNHVDETTRRACSNHRRPADGGASASPATRAHRIVGTRLLRWTNSTSRDGRAADGSFQMEPKYGARNRAGLDETLAPDLLFAPGARLSSAFGRSRCICKAAPARTQAATRAIAMREEHSSDCRRRCPSPGRLSAREVSADPGDRSDRRRVALCAERVSRAMNRRTSQDRESCSRVSTCKVESSSAERLATTQSFGGVRSAVGRRPGRSG